MAKPTIGFIGLGIMGRYMAGHILAAGYPMQVFNRTSAKADDLVARGAERAAGPEALAAACDVIITMVGYPADVEEVYLGNDGLIARARDGATFIDMTTSSPALAVKIAEAAAARGLKSLDAPVSGGDVGGEAPAGDPAAAFPAKAAEGENTVLRVNVRPRERNTPVGPAAGLRGPSGNRSDRGYRCERSGRATYRHQR